jgi:hypothetical protein
MKRGARARGSQPSSREAEGHRPGSLRSSAVSGWTRWRTKAEKSRWIRARRAHPHPEVRSLRLKTPQRMFAAASAVARIRALRIAQARAALTRNVGGAPQGDALSAEPPSQAARRRATTTMLRLAALHSPHSLRGKPNAHPAHGAGTMARGCLKGAV